MDAIALELIRGIGFGIQYFDDFEDDDGAWFVLILELGIVRLMFFWDRNQNV